MPTFVNFSPARQAGIENKLIPFTQGAGMEGTVKLIKYNDGTYCVLKKDESFPTDGLSTHFLFPADLYQSLVHAGEIKVHESADYHYHLGILSAAVGLAEGALWYLLQSWSQAELITIIPVMTATLSLLGELAWHRYKNKEWPNTLDRTAMLSDAKLTLVQIIADVTGELVMGDLTKSLDPRISALLCGLASGTFVTTAVAFTESPYEVQAEQEKITLMKAAGLDQGTLRKRSNVSSSTSTLFKTSQQSTFSFLRTSNAAIFAGSCASTVGWNVINQYIEEIIPSFSSSRGGVVGASAVRAALMAVLTGGLFWGGVELYKFIAACFEGKDELAAALAVDQSSKDEESGEDHEKALLLDSERNGASLGSAKYGT